MSRYPYDKLLSRKFASANESLADRQTMTVPSIGLSIDAYRHDHKIAATQKELG